MSVLFLKFKSHSTSNFSESFHSTFNHETHQEGRNKPLPLSHPLPQGTAERHIPQGITDKHQAAGAGEPRGMAKHPQASPSPLPRRLQAENHFPSVCPAIPSTPRPLSAEPCGAPSAPRRGALAFHTRVSWETRAAFVPAQTGTG